MVKSIFYEKFSRRKTKVELSSSCENTPSHKMPGAILHIASCVNRCLSPSWHQASLTYHKSTDLAPKSAHKRTEALKVL